MHSYIFAVHILNSNSWILLAPFILIANISYFAFTTLLNKSSELRQKWSSAAKAVYKCTHKTRQMSSLLAVKHKNCNKLHDKNSYLESVPRVIQRKVTRAVVLIKNSSTPLPPCIRLPHFVRLVTMRWNGGIEREREKNM